MYVHVAARGQPWVAFFRRHPSVYFLFLRGCSYVSLTGLKLTMLTSQLWGDNMGTRKLNLGPLQEDYLHCRASSYLACPQLVFYLIYFLRWHFPEESGACQLGKIGSEEVLEICKHWDCKLMPLARISMQALGIQLGSLCLHSKHFVGITICPDLTTGIV